MGRSALQRAVGLCLMAGKVDGVLFYVVNTAISLGNYQGQCVPDLQTKPSVRYMEMKCFFSGSLLWGQFRVYKFLCFLVQARSSKVINS